MSVNDEVMAHQDIVVVVVLFFSLIIQLVVCFWLGVQVKS